MKRKIFVVVMCLCCMTLIGCGKKSFAYAAVVRDSYNTGGTLSFVYDKNTKSAIFGGEGEVVQFYSEDVAKGWSESGCRVGVKLAPPPNLKDYKSATAKLGDKELIYSDFFVGDEIKYAIFQPIVSKDKSHVVLKIKWNENSKEQTYHIIIKEGTYFMQEEK